MPKKFKRGPDNHLDRLIFENKQQKEQIVELKKESTKKLTGKDEQIKLLNRQFQNLKTIHEKCPPTQTSTPKKSAFEYSGPAAEKTQRLINEAPDESIIRYIAEAKKPFNDARTIGAILIQQRRQRFRAENTIMTLESKLDKLETLCSTQQLAIQAFSDTFDLINKCCSEGHNFQPLKFQNDLIALENVFSPAYENRRSCFKMSIKENILELLKTKSKDNDKLSGGNAIHMYVGPERTRLKYAINRKYSGYLTSRIDACKDGHGSTSEDEEVGLVMEEVD